MNTYIGLDVHSSSSTLVSVDETGKILNRSQIATTEKNLLGFVRNEKRPRKLVVEETNLAQWVYVLLHEQVDELVVCNPGFLGKKVGAKNDLADATHLANELRCGHVVPVFHEHSKMMELRALVSAYGDVNRQIVMAKNRYKALFRSEALTASGSKIYTSPERIKELSRSTSRFVAEHLLSEITNLEEIKKKYRELFKANMQKHAILRRLDTIPGIDCIRAHFIAATICSADRFKNKHKLWAYSMLVKYSQESDGRTYGLKAVQGRRELKGVFMGIAETNLKGNSNFRKYYDQLRSKDLTHKQAKKAVARKVAAICLAVMRRNVDYDDKLEEKEARLKKKQV